MGKKYIKNITDDKSLGYESAIMSFKENGKRITLKPGEKAETKLNGENVDGKRLQLIDVKKEDKNDN